MLFFVRSDENYISYRQFRWSNNLYRSLLVYLRPTEPFRSFTRYRSLLIEASGDIARQHQSQNSLEHYPASSVARTSPTTAIRRSIQLLTLSIGRLRAYQLASNLGSSLGLLASGRERTNDYRPVRFFLSIYTVTFSFPGWNSAPEVIFEGIGEAENGTRPIPHRLK